MQPLKQEWKDYEKFNQPYIVIDTENKDLEEVKDIVDGIMNGFIEIPKQYKNKK